MVREPRLASSATRYVVKRYVDGNIADAEPIPVSPAGCWHESQIASWTTCDIGTVYSSLAYLWPQGDSSTSVGERLNPWRNFSIGQDLRPRRPTKARLSEKSSMSGRFSPV